MSTKKAYWQMTTSELKEATREFDAEDVGTKTFKSPNQRQREQLARAKRKRGRPRVGKGARVISVSIESGLLTKVDALAKRKRSKRGTLIALGLQAILDGRIMVPTMKE